MIDHLIHIGDGRYVTSVEGALTPPPPKKINKPKKPAKDYHPPPLNPPSHSRPNKNPRERRDRIENIPGYSEYLRFILGMAGKYGFAGFQPGQSEGYNRRQLEELRAAAIPLVKKDMANIKKQIDLPEMAEEALEGALTVLRTPNSQQTKLAAAKLILEFTKTKPVAKSEVSVNKAEEWLATLAADD
jgi:hypothetical protein